jgi:hypothetical protein
MPIDIDVVEALEDIQADLMALERLALSGRLSEPYRQALARIAHRLLLLAGNGLQRAS